MRHSSAILALFLGISPFACASHAGPETGSDDDEGAVEEVDGKADGVKLPLVTYLADQGTEYADDFRVTHLTIKSDKTFYRGDHGPACDPDGNCQDGVADYKGTIKFYKTKNGKRTIRFYDANGDRID